MRLPTLFLLLSVLSTHSLHQSDALSTAKAFLVRVTAALESSDVASLSALFADAFSFSGCTKHLDKQAVVALLAKVPRGAHFAFTLTKAYFMDNGDVRYEVRVEGLAMQFDAVFTLRDTQLVEGRVKDCPTLAARLFGAQDGSQLIVLSFLERLSLFIASRDIQMVAFVIDDSFKFTACSGKVYDKEMVLNMIRRVPDDVAPTFRLISSKHASQGVIDYEVSIQGFGANTLQAQFSLSSVGLVDKLVSGNISKC